MTEAIKTEKPKKTSVKKEEVVRRVAKKISKGEMEKILTTLLKDPLSAKKLSTKHSIAITAAAKIKNTLANTQWKKVTPETPLPVNYIFPKNTNQMVISVMYDMGYFS
jgi:hypothetical protein